jgi:hypothetical protein
MKQTIIASLAAMACMSIGTWAFEGDDNPAIYAQRDKMGWGKQSENFAGYGWVDTMTKNHQQVAQEIAAKARSRLGEKWVEPALRIAKIESGYTCHVKGPKTRHGRAVGPLQVLVPSAETLGISAYELNSSCTAQIEAGIRHMERCIELGAKTSAQFASCHVSGSPFSQRLTRKAERYRQKYIKLAENAKIPNWVGPLHYW